jgi:four helix bundle protein
MKNNIIKEKSFEFAIKIVQIYSLLCERKEFVMSNQLLRSGTSIGANIREAISGQSTADFIHKMNISLKECSETQYWLELLYATNYLSKEEFDSIYPISSEIFKILNSIIITSKKNIKS